jgi:hypothetical protein
LLDELASIVAVYALAFVVAMISGASRKAALSLVVLLLPLPLVNPSDVALVRAITANGTALILFRTIDLSLGHTKFSGFRSRLWHLVALYDTRRASRARPMVDLPNIIRAAIYAVIAYLGLLVAEDLAARFEGPAHYAVRWSGGYIHMLFGIESAAASLVYINRAIGFIPPPVHDAPARSRTVQEFWGVRWNKIISSWLNAHCLRPLAARRRPLLGLALAFVVSAVLHAYFTWAAISLEMALIMGAFFLVQLPIVLLERKLHVARWPLLASHVWTIGWFALTGPLFLEPYLQILDPLFR